MRRLAEVVKEPGERWLPVPGYEGLYEVSDLGRVASLPRKDRLGRDVCGCLLLPKLRRGYETMALLRDGKRSYRQAHALVLLAFVGPLPPGMQTRHGPGGKLDNRLVNLCYGTPAENIHDMIRDGARCPNGDRVVKLTPGIVADCRRRYSEGETVPTLAAEHDVSKPTMSLAIRGKTWASVPGAVPAPPSKRGPDGRFTHKLLRLDMANGKGEK